MNNIPPTQKNIVYGNITAGGDVHIGDITYNIVEDFSHSILFLRIEPLNGDLYATQLTLKSRHTRKMGLNTTGLPLFHENVKLTISSKLFEQVDDFQSLRRQNDLNFRKNELTAQDSLVLEDEQLGRLLFDTFFKSDILTVCQDFVELLEKRKIEELLLAISVDDTQVVNLPFEMVIPFFFPEKLGQTRQSLAVNHFGLVRTLEKDLAHFDMQGKAPSAAPLKMLFVTALPENLDERSKMLEIEEEQKRLINAIGSFEATGGRPNLVIEFLDTASLNEISEALGKHQHDILHISGHGSYQQTVKQGVLHLEDDEGNHCEVTGATLGETLRQHQCLKLLLLSACETAIAGNGVVEQLATFGVPAVVAMRFSVTDVGAKVFTTALYAALVKGETLTHALATARESLWVYVQTERKQNPNRPHLAEWFTPVVYLNQYAEGLVNLKADYVLPQDFYPHSDFFKTKNTRLIGAGFIGRKRYLNTLRRSFAQRQHVCVHGLGGMGKTTLAEAFTHNYDNHSHEIIIFRNGNQIAEKYILDELFARLEADLNANKNMVRQLKQFLNSDADPQTKLQALIDNYLQNRKTILVFDNFEDVQTIETDEQQYHITSQSLAEFMRYLCQNTPSNCHLLFTTRYEIADLMYEVRHIALDKMSYAEQYRLTNFSETLRQIPMTERQDVFRRLDGHPRAYEFLETLLKTDKSLDWTKLSKQIGEVEAKVWENLLLEKLYQYLNPAEQQLLQICSTFITRTPIAALEYVLGKAALKIEKLELVQLLGLCFYDVENQTFEVHRLTREWMIKSVIDGDDVKKWAFLAGEYYSKGDVIPIHYIELAREYYRISENWERFKGISFGLQYHYGIIGFSKRVYELNVEVFNQNIDANSNAAALNNIGHMILGRLKFKGDIENALEYFKESLNIQKNFKECKGIGVTLSNIAKVYEIKGDFRIAMNYLEQSIKAHEEEGNLNGKALTLDKICQIYLSKGDGKIAYDLAMQSLKIFEELKDDRGIGSALNNLGVALLIKKEYDKCIPNFNKSLLIRQNMNHMEGIATTLSNLAMTYYQGNLGNDSALLQRSYILEPRYLRVFLCYSISKGHSLPSIGIYDMTFYVYFGLLMLHFSIHHFTSKSCFISKHDGFI